MNAPYQLISVRAEAARKAELAGRAPCREVAHGAECEGGCHQHAIEHPPQGLTGYGVCECGATIRVENGRTVGEWHACKLCVVGAP